MTHRLSLDDAATAARRATLRKHKAFATGLLLLAAVVFLACSWLQSRGVDALWLGIIRAGAEAGMVGGLADWFAVTALFRHPLGIPIWHTAIIPTKKDEVGQQLSGFVAENFLNAEELTKKAVEADIPSMVARYLVEPRNAQRLSTEVGKIVADALRGLDPQEAEAIIKSQVLERLREPEWGPPAGRVLAGYIADGKLEPLVDELVNWAYRKVLSMENEVVTLIDERMPGWAPRFARELVGEKVYRELVAWTTEVKRDPVHPARAAVRRNLEQLAQDMQDDPAMIARVEAIKEDVMDSEQVSVAAGHLWAAISSGLIAQAEDAESVLRVKTQEFIMRWAQRILDEPELHATYSGYVENGVAYFANNYGTQLTDIISEKITSWGAEEASENIELMVGKDLQYIRVNGTVVGSIAGIVIFLVNHVLFG